jgi:low temperature requirement protein LtrA
MIFTFCFLALFVLVMFWVYWNNSSQSARTVAVKNNLTQRLWAWIYFFADLVAELLIGVLTIF